MPKTTKPKKMWVYAPKKPAPPKVPDALKREVETKANALVESVLKPLHVQPPPEDPEFNYIEDLSTKWFRSFFYFYAIYRRRAPMRWVRPFEHKFARLTYLGGDHFNLAAIATQGSGSRSSLI